MAKGGHHGAGPGIPNNLPRYLTTFVGRDGDLRALKAVLAGSRMVTLMGTGGSGKSRLATDRRHRAEGSH